MPLNVQLGKEGPQCRLAENFSEKYFSTFLKYGGFRGFGLN